MCNRCDGRSLACNYDAREGITKRQQLQHDSFDNEVKLERAMRILSHLQQGSDQEAAECLARLRLGSSLDDEYCRILLAYSTTLPTAFNAPAELKLASRQQCSMDMEPDAAARIGPFMADADVQPSTSNDNSRSAASRR